MLKRNFLDLNSHIIFRMIANILLWMRNALHSWYIWFSVGIAIFGKFKHDCIGKGSMWFAKGFEVIRIHMTLKFFLYHSCLCRFNFQFLPLCLTMDATTTIVAPHHSKPMIQNNLFFHKFLFIIVFYLEIIRCSDQEAHYFHEELDYVSFMKNMKIFQT